MLIFSFCVTNAIKNPPTPSGKGWGEPPSERDSGWGGEFALSVPCPLGVIIQQILISFCYSILF